MALTSKVRQVERWTITPAGRRAADFSERCCCDVKIMGILFACPDCKTVYGCVKDMQRPRAAKWTYGRRA